MHDQIAPQQGSGLFKATTMRVNKRRYVVQASKQGCVLIISCPESLELRGPMTHPLATSGAEELLAESSQQRPASRSQTSLAASGPLSPEETEGPPMAVVGVIVLAHAVPCPHLPYSQ